MAPVLIAMMLGFLFIQFAASQTRQNPVLSAACIEAGTEYTTYCPDSVGQLAILCTEECQTAFENIIRQCPPQVASYVVANTL